MFKSIHYLLLLPLLFTLTPFSWAMEFSDSCGKAWQWTNPSPQGNTLNDIIWFDEQHQFVAVGAVGAILTSHDTVNWQTQNSGTDKTLNAISNNSHNQLIAVGHGGIILSSSDGVNWQTQTSGTTANLHAIHWNGSYWVASGNVILTSYDGIFWQKTSDFGVRHIDWNGQQWVGVGSYGLIVTSADGINWYRKEVGTQGITSQEFANGVGGDNYSAADFYLILWNGFQWIAFGSDSQEGIIYMVSSDGDRWKKGENVDHVSFFPNQKSWNGELWISVGSNGAIYSSPDGIHWKWRYSGGSNLYGITWNGDQWVAVGRYGVILISNDGINWKQRSSSVISRSGINLFGLHWNGQLWVAVGYRGTILSSEDGIHWKKQTSDLSTLTAYFYDVHWNGELWIAVGSNGIQSSTDGVLWQRSSNYSLRKILWNGTIWVGVGTSGKIVSSSDSINWEQQSSGTSADLDTIAWNGTLWLAAGGQTILTSSDGINWQNQTDNANNPIKDISDVSWNGQYWVAVGRYNTIATSSDSKNWQLQSSGTSNTVTEQLNAVAWNGTFWIAVGSGFYIDDPSTVFISTDGINWQLQNTLSTNGLKDIQWNGNQWVAVGHGGTILTSNCYTKINTKQTHAIIIAGGGNKDDPLQDATNTNANLAYRTLRQRGISAEKIQYFNAIAQDADKDGFIDTQAVVLTQDIIKQSLTQWAVGELDSETLLLVYLIDHGSKELFYLSKPANDYAQIITAPEFSSWLNTLQENTSARVSLVYDACHSGSFMNDLKHLSLQNFDRITLFSSQTEQLSYFGAKGTLSYSYFFWNNIAQGMDLRTAHHSATVAIRATTQNNGKSYQTTTMDDNGDGKDSWVDGSLALDTYLGIDNNQQVTYPQIVTHQESTTIDISQDGTLDLFARVDLDKDKIERVWAVVIPPDSKTTGSEAITELPVIELDNYNPVNGYYEASSDLFTQSGQYTVSYYAKTKAGVNSRFPVVSLITVTDSGYQALEQKNLHAVIVVGEDAGSSLHKAASNNANLAYLTLRNRGVNRDNIYYLNNETQDADGDGQTDTQSKIVSSSAIKNALKQWAQSKVNSSTPLLIYLIGNGADKEFIVSSSDTLSAETLANWVNELQNNTKARVTFIYDAPKAGSFMTAMATPNKEHERINLFSTQAEQGAYYGAEGQLSFSYFFWSNTARGLDVRRAFLNTRRTLSTATRSLRSVDSYQQALMDDNGDGVWNSHSDGSLAKVTHLGLNAATASTFPVIFEHQVSALNSENIKLSAKVDLPPELIKKVWVLINAPQQSVTTVTAISQLPEVELTYNPQNKTFAGTTAALSQTGNYTLTYYAQSTQGNISEPVNSIVQVDDSGQSSLFQCATIDSDINITLPCISVGQQLYQASLTLPQNSDSILWQLNSISINQSVADNAQCTTIDNKANLLINCLRIGRSDYKILLNFHQKDQQFWWEFGGLIEQ
ncbi:MAG: hypothetical protein KZQ83_16060 [gamma proteobacterium symbiont of Taylorina sp.]|nr:hypothetical protein [gamma proteobacterium symbiont of Taylorina sp.]